MPSILTVDLSKSKLLVSLGFRGLSDQIWSAEMLQLEINIYFFRKDTSESTYVSKTQFFQKLQVKQ